MTKNLNRNSSKATMWANDSFFNSHCTLTGSIPQDLHPEARERQVRSRMKVKAEERVSRLWGESPNIYTLPLTVKSIAHCRRLLEQNILEGIAVAACQWRARELLYFLHPFFRKLFGKKRMEGSSCTYMFMDQHDWNEKTVDRSMKEEHEMKSYNDLEKSS